MLVAEGFGVSVPKGYVYFSMGFALLVELLNIRAQRSPVKLRKAQLGDLVQPRE